MMTEDELHAAYPDLFQAWFDRGYAAGQLKLERDARKEMKQAREEAKPASACVHADLKFLEGQVRHWKHNFEQVKIQLSKLKEQHKNPIRRLYIRQNYPTSRWKRSTKLKAGFCIYCGADSQTLDHMIPKSRGGGDGPENRVEACYGCDNEKGNMTYDEYMIWRKYHKP